MVGRQVTRRGRIRAATPALLAALVLLLLHGAAPVAHAAPPSNDDRTGATPITLLGSEGAFGLAESTVAGDDPAPCPGGEAVQGSVWFAYTAVESGPVIVSFSGDTGPALPALHVLDADGTTEIGCAVTFAPGFVEPHVDLDASAGETYLIAIAGRTDLDTTGYVVIEPPIVVSLDPVTSGHVTATGAVVVSYVFSCAHDMSLETGLSLTQGSGAGLAMGGTLETHNCLAPGVTIALTAMPGDGPNPNARFHAGAAEAIIRFNAQSFAEFYQSPAETKAIQLTGGPAATPPPTDTLAAIAVGHANEGPPMAFWMFGAGLGLLMLKLAWPSLRRSRSRRA